MEASQLLNEAISTESRPIYVLLRGFQYFFTTDYEESLKDFHRCLEIDPEFNKAHYYIAKTMFLMLEIPEYIQRISLCPTLEDPYATNELQLDDYFKKAIAACDLAIMHDDTDAKSWLLRARIYLEQEARL